MHYINCPLCGKNSTKVIFTKASLNKDITNVICINCGLVYINPCLSSAEYVEFHKEDFLGYKNLKEARQVLPKLKSSDLTIKKTIVLFLDEFVSAGQNILDVGCGFGTLLDILKKEKQVNVFGVEVGNLDVKVAKEYFGLDNIFHSSLEEFAAKDENSKKFDIVIMNHVLEHLPEPLKSLEQIRRVLKSSGLLYIGVPNILNIKKRPEEFFQYFHTLNFSPHSLKAMLEQGGFGIVKFNLNAGLPGGMEVAAKIGMKSLDMPELEVGVNYEDVVNYVKRMARKYQRLRTLRDSILFFLPQALRIRAGRLAYLFLKRKSFK